ncbi:hypothetical protein F0U61_12345 [Archangium violaceum]|uniref:adventurous gliding motility protein AgmC n=1 Tax=Archangium violaceum TaxID=83451 RepID=UPI002B2A725F|nr:hypothetical protein F0U61_12345 [Archangium violaceum]
MRGVYIWALLVLVLLVAGPALAEPDSFYLGKGTTDGSVEINTSDVIINSYAYVTKPLAPGDDTILITGVKNSSLRKAASVAAFKANDLVMVLQTTGIVPAATAGQTTPIDLGASDVGRWEFARLESVTGTTLTLSAPLSHAYAANVTQVIRVPEYTNFWVKTNGIIKAEPWDGRSGGVIALLATGAVTVNGQISTKGAGFFGGQYVQDSSLLSGCAVTSVDAYSGPIPAHAQKGEGIDSTRYSYSSDSSTFDDNGGAGRGNFANGGGGGVCVRSGGGGGANAGNGGKGGNTAEGTGRRPVGGMGGVPLVYSLLERLTFGGGGGSGHGKLSNSPVHSSGGAGGGIIFIRANSLSLSNESALDASGAPGLRGTDKDSSTPSTADAGGGGGAGGTILLRVNGTLNCNDQNNAISVQGGAGGEIDGGATLRPGGGGGGGGGRVLYQANTVTTCGKVTAAGGLAGSGDSVAGSPGVISSIEDAFTNLTVPVVNNPSGTISDTTPPISGTAQPGKQVVLYLNGVEVGRTYALADGSYSFQVQQVLADGDYTATAAITERGVYSKKSDEQSFKVDATAPLPPVVKTLGTRARPASDGMLIGGRLDLASNNLSITGTAEANSTVTVQQSGCSTVSKTTNADSGGNWSLSNLAQPSNTEAECTLEVSAADKATPPNPGKKTTLKFNLDTRSPTEPSVTTIADQSTATTVLINTPWPVFEGTADAGNEVELTLSWTNMGAQQRVFKTTASATGAPASWSIAAPEALGDFTYTLAVKARDPAGNESGGTTSSTFKVDTTAPAKPEVKKLGTRDATAGILIGPPDMTLNAARTQYVLTVSGKAIAETTVKVVQAGSPTSPRTTTANAAGDWSVELAQPLDTEAEYKLEVTAEDEAHNVSEPTTLGFKLDTKKPAAPVVTKVDSQTPMGPTGSCTATSLPYVTTGQPLIRGTGEARGRIEVTLTAASTYNLPPTVVSGLPESLGSWSVSPISTIDDATAYTLSVTVTDEAGNPSLSSTYCFAVDATPPSKPTSITLGTASAKNGMLIGRAGVTAISDADPAKPTGTLSISGRAETSSTMSLKLIPLSADIPMPAEKTPGAPSGAWSSSWSGLVSGSYAVEARVKDAVGNMGPPETIFFELDLVRPTVIITGNPPKGSTTTSRDAVFGFEPSEKVTAYRCHINGIAQAGCVSPLFFSMPTSETTGAYTLEVWATDLAGNETLATAPSTWNWKVDSDQPTVDILNVGIVGGIPASGGATNSTEIEFKLQANKPNLRLDCKRDSEAWEEPCRCDSTIPDPEGDDGAICVRRYSSLSDIPHILLAKAKSAETGAETPEYAWRRYEWEVDITNPDTFVTLRPDAWKAVNFVRVEFTTPAEGRTATFECDLNGVVFPCSSPLVRSDLEDREYKLRIRAKDQAGNIEDDPEEVSWTVDTKKPDAPVVQLPAQGARYKDLALRGTAVGEGLSTISVYLDDNEKAPIGTAVVTDNDNGDWQLLIDPAQKPPDGSHFIRVKATDRAGNPGVMSEPVHFVMDNEPPIVQITGPDKNSASSSADFRFTSNEEGVTFQCKLDLNEPVDCGSEVSFSDLEQGPHTLNVYATDEAGNKRETGYSWSIFLGLDIRAEGGGLGCSTASAGPSMLWLLGLLGLLLKASQHRSCKH